jgi:hypothetical protein
VLAVPRSIPMSTEKRPSAHSIGLKTLVIASSPLAPPGPAARP